MSAGYLFERYTEAFWDKCHGNLESDPAARGYGAWYHDSLPEERDAPILDVGCGTGEFLAFLQASGYSQIEGLDISLQQVERARQLLSCPVHQGEPESFLRDRQGHYRLITLNDVLEHIPKHETMRFLKTLRGGLSQDGILVVSVPQVAGFSSMYTRYNDFTHHLVFTELSLEYALRLSGFSEVRFVQEQWPWKCTPRHLSYRLARWCWFKILKFIYFIEMPWQKPPVNWQNRIVAVARP